MDPIPRLNTVARSSIDHRDTEDPTPRRAPLDRSVRFVANRFTTTSNTTDAKPVVEAHRFAAMEQSDQARRRERIEARWMRSFLGAVRVRALETIDRHAAELERARAEYQDPAAYDRLREAIGAARQLVEKQHTLEARVGALALGGDRGDSPRVRGGLEAQIASLQREKAGIDASLRLLTDAAPGLRAIGVEKIDEAELVGAVQEGFHRIAAELEDVRERVASGDIPPERLDRIAAQVEAELDPEERAAIREHLGGGQTAWIAGGATLALGAGAAIASGGLAVALGLAGAAVGAGTAAHELEIADDVLDASQVGLHDEELADPKTARFAYAMGIATLALAGLDLGLAARTGHLYGLSREVQDILHRELGASGIERLARGLDPRSAWRLRGEIGAGALKRLLEQVDGADAQKLSAVLDSATLRRVAESGVARRALERLNAGHAPAVVRRFVEMFPPARAMKHLASLSAVAAERLAVLDPTSLERVVRLRPELVERAALAVDARALATLVQRYGASAERLLTATEERALGEWSRVALADLEAHSVDDLAAALSRGTNPAEVALGLSRPRSLSAREIAHVVEGELSATKKFAGGGHGHDNMRVLEESGFERLDAADVRARAAREKAYGDAVDLHDKAVEARSRWDNRRREASRKGAPFAEARPAVPPKPKASEFGFSEGHVFLKDKIYFHAEPNSDSDSLIGGIHPAQNAIHRDGHTWFSHRWGPAQIDALATKLQTSNVGVTIKKSSSMTKYTAYARVRDDGSVELATNVLAEPWKKGYTRVSLIEPENLSAKRTVFPEMNQELANE